MKFWLWLAIALAVIWLWRSHSRRASGPAQPPRSNLPASEPMVSCAHCGLHIPASEAVTQGQLHFCSNAHRQLHFPS